MAFKFQDKYKSCTFSDFAVRVGVSKNTFYTWITKEEWKQMIDLGYIPYKHKLIPSVVKFLIDKFLDIDKESNEISYSDFSATIPLNTLKFQDKYKSCTIQFFAESVGVSKDELFSWITKDELKQMIDLGYLPYKYTLPPQVVKFLSDKFLDVNEKEV